VRACLLIPIFDHAATIRGVVESLAPFGLPLLIENDGSGGATRVVLDALGKEHDWIAIEHHEQNRGKGFALKQGYLRAAARGFTHVVQLDADGQHDASDVGRFLQAMAARPDALVVGQPVFDASAPKSRLWGRKLSVWLVALATLSRRIGDPLCGFRGVPLAPVLRLLDHVELGDHMEFEPDLAVRLVWDGTPVVHLATRVRYFANGISHFDVVWDDLRLAWLYVRLGLGMLARLPGLLAARGRAPA
jgi:glycosyltransferase involved in cell wall biosynthesis